MPHTPSVSRIDDLGLQRKISLFNDELLNLPDELIAKLTNAAANPGAGLSDLRDFIQFLEGLDLDLMRCAGNTIVHEVVRAGEVKFIALLSQYNIDFNQLNARKLSPLHYLFDEDCYGHLADDEYEAFFFPLVCAFLNAHANFRQKDSHGSHISHYAAKVGCVSVLELLTEYGFYSNEANDHGVTPLHEAARLARYQVVDLLFERSNANPGKQDDNGNTALHFLFQEGNLEDDNAHETIAALLCRGGSGLMNIANHEGVTPRALFERCNLTDGDRERLIFMIENDGLSGELEEELKQESAYQQGSLCFFTNEKPSLQASTSGSHVIA